MPKQKLTIKEQWDFGTAIDRADQASSLLMAIEISCERMEKTDIESALGGIRCLLSDVYTSLKKIEGGCDA